MAKTTDTMTISADIAAVLSAGHNNALGTAPIRGNVAAHAYNATQGGGLEGINLGWVDQEASTDFLCAIVSGVDDAWSNALAAAGGDRSEVDDEITDEVWEIVDTAVPIATWAAVSAALELGLANEPTGGRRTADDMATMYDTAVAVLLDLGESVAHGLLTGLLNLVDERA